MSSWAIDLGNSNSGVARWDPEAEEPRLVGLDRICRQPGGDEPLEAPRLVPSAVHALEADDWRTRLGRLPFLRRHWFLGREALIGRPALEKNAMHVHPSFVRGFKPYLGRESRRPLARLGKRSINARDAARLFLRELFAEIQHVTGERVRELVMTTPVEAYEAYRAELLSIARQFGVGRVRFIDEPVAAALGYGLSVGRERLLLVVDFGAGTFQITLVRLTAKEMMQGTARVVAKAGRALGGNHVTAWLLGQLAEKMGYELDPARDDETEMWRRVMFAEAERVKERVFFEPSVAVRMQPPAYLRRPGAEAGDALVEIERKELEQLLDQHGVYRMIDETLVEVLTAAADRGVAEGDVEEVLMVGGSTLLPEVYPRFEHRFGRDKVRAWQPFEAVVHGACAYAADSYSPSDFIVHDYAFVTYDPDDHDPEYTVIVPRGTRFPTPPDLWKRQLVPTCSLGEPETMFRLVVCEIGKAAGDDRRFVWDQEGALKKLGGKGASNGDPVVVPLNQSNPTLGRLDPPHSPRDRRPRLEIAFGVNSDRWLVATVEDLRTNKMILREEPVVRLL